MVCILRRFWLEFEIDWQRWRPGEAVLGLGVGITGWDLPDCLAMLRVITHLDDLPPLLRVVEDVDLADFALATLGRGVPVWRGIWHPPLNLKSSGRWDSWAPWRDPRNDLPVAPRQCPDADGS